MDSTGIALDIGTFGIGGREANAVQLGYSSFEIGVDLFSLDFNQGNLDWYNSASTILDFAGIAIPVAPDALSIILNLSHSLQCQESR